MNSSERFRYFNQSDIFNLKPPKNPNEFLLNDNVNKNKIKEELSKSQKNIINEINYNNKKNIDHLSYLYNNDDNNNNNTKKNFIKELRKQIKEDSMDFSNTKVHDLYLKNKSKANGDLNLLKTNNKIKDDFLTTNLIFNKYMEARVDKYKKIFKNKNNSTKNIYDPKKFFKKTSNINSKNTSNLNYNPNNNSIKNKINFYKSNIFNDTEKSKLDETFEPKTERKNINSNNNNNIKKHIKKDIEYLPKLDWQNATTEIWTKGMEESEEYKKNKNDNNNYPKKNLLNKLNSNDSSDKIFSENINKKYNGITENFRVNNLFEIDGINNNKNFNIDFVKKIFNKNGLHFFGEKVDSEFSNDGKAKFYVRKDVEDKNYEKKIEKALKEVKIEEGFDVKEIKNKNNENVILVKKNPKIKQNWMKNKLNMKKTENKKK